MLPMGMIENRSMSGFFQYASTLSEPEDLASLRDVCSTSRRPTLQYSLRPRGQHFHVNKVPARQLLTPDTRHLKPFVVVYGFWNLITSIN
jgi:hypothetical protein